MKNANRKFTDTNIRINCRLSYAHLFEPRVPKSDPTAKPKYDACLIVPKSDEQAVKLINDAFGAATKLYVEKFGKPKSKLKSTVKDGDDERPDDPVVADSYYINANSISQPGLKILENGMMVDALDDNDIYSGCYVAADINFSPYDNDAAHGIGCYINNILKLEDGEKLSGGGLSADEAFDDLL